ncbi:MAG: GNAT family N-acetyltransferase [Candidatus Hodarchaeota archaeon]
MQVVEERGVTIQIYSADEAVNCLIKNRELIQELMGKDKLYRYPVADTFLNQAFLEYTIQMRSHLYLGTIEEDGEIHALLPLLINQGFPSPAMNRIEFLVMRPSTNLAVLEYLFEQILAIVDRYNVPLRFYCYEFTNPKVRDIVLNLGLKEAGAVKGIMYDLKKNLNVPIREKIVLKPAEDPAVWFPMMLAHYNLPGTAVNYITSVLSKQEEGLQELMQRIFHRFIATDSKGEVVGTIELWTVTEDPQWTHLFVKEEYRGQGYGMAIMQAIKQKTLEMNYNRAIGIVNATNTPARNLHSKFGSETTSTIVYFDRQQSEQ